MASGAALALSLAGCRSWTRNTRVAYALITDPPPLAYDPVMMGIVRAVLPFEHPEFPALPPADVQAQLMRLFPIDRESRFITLQRGLAMFDEVDLFPHAFAPIVDQEASEIEDDLPRDEWVARGVRADTDRYAEFVREWRATGNAFTNLPLAAQRAYLTMWMRSSFAVRRRFARSAKSIVTIAAYSMAPLWEAIGYRGPVLEERRASP